MELVHQQAAAPPRSRPHYFPAAERSSPASEAPSLTDERRLAALQRCRLLDSEPEEAFDRVGRLAARLLGAPVALVSLVEPHRQFNKSVVGLGALADRVREVPISHSLCRNVVAGAAPFAVEDAAGDPRVRDNPAWRSLGLTAYLGVPFRSRTGEVLGALCVLDREPRAWSSEDGRTLEELAAVLTDEVELREVALAHREAVCQLDAERRATAARRRLVDTSLDAISDLFFILDLDARLSEWNARVGEVTGYSADELAAMNPTGFFDPDDHPRILEALERALANGHETVEATLVTKDGRRIPYEFSGTALHDERGQLVGLCGTARDLTERKEAEVALQQSEARYRGLVEASPDIFFRLSREGRHRDVIVADPTKLAVDIDAIVGFTVAELLPPPVAEQWQEAIGAALDTGQLREIEYELHTLSGELHRYEARMVPVGSDEVQAIVRDVTERYRSERALRANEIRFRSFVEATAQVVFRADAAGGVTELSDAWSRFTGQTPEEVEGWGWVEAVHPEDRAWVLAEWADHIEARTPYAPEFRVRRRDGVYHRFSVRSVPVHDGDTFLGWVGTCTDVEDVRRSEEALRQSEEALRQSEERRRLALEAAQMGTWAYDIAGDTVAWSPRTYALFGIEPAREPYPKAAFYDLLHEADRDRLRAATEAAVREAGAGGSGEIDVEYRVPRAGELRWFRSVGRVVLDEAQRPARVMGTVRDVTDEKAHEAALVEAKEAAEEARVRSEEARRAAEDAARLKSALLANMSHEIRTPLTGIIGFAEVLAEEVQGEQGEFARLIGRNGRRLMNTLDSVLDLAQIEAGRYRLVPDVLDLGAAASEAVSLFHLQAEAKGIGLRVEAPATPVRALADASALARVIINLVSNAVKFTSEGAVTVTVRGVEEAPGHGAAEVRVADSGVGIADAFLPNVFEEFRQESEGEARYFEGSGLGLSITRRLVEMMGGSIAVESEKGIGSTFTVRLPQAD